ncbi:27047_t:CDS:1, partial [Gigaspora margarita]
IKQKIQEKIKVKLQEHDLNFIQNPKLFFEKMLERFGSSIHLDRLFTNNNLLTNPEEIKTQIQYYFQNY